MIRYGEHTPVCEVCMHTVRALPAGASRRQAGAHWCYNESKGPLAAVFLFIVEQQRNCEQSLERNQLLQIQCDWANMDTNKRGPYIQKAGIVKLEYDNWLAGYRANGRYRTLL